MHYCRALEEEAVHTGRFRIEGVDQQGKKNVVEQDNYKEGVE